MNARVFAALGALLCGFAVAFAAMGAHAHDAEAGRRLSIAAAFFFGHGLALIELRARAGRLALAARALLLAGVLLFAGSLVGAALLATPTSLAPLGGTLLMLGWLLAAVDFLRKD